MRPNSGKPRQPHEKYYTPHSVTHALAAREYFQKIIDPAAGGWHIVDAFKALGIPATGSDLEPDIPGMPKLDFLKAVRLDPAQAFDIVTNPPYGVHGKAAVAFIKHALLLTEPHGGRVAMLLRNDFDGGETRRALFDDHPAFARKYTLTDRVYWANLEHTERPGPPGHAWYVWDWRNGRRPPTQHWLHAPAGGFR